MEEEEHTDRKQQLAMLYQKLNKIKKSLNEGNKDSRNLCSLFTDDTDNINQVISSNSPKSCLSYLTDLEKKGDPYTDCNHLTRLVDSYTKVFSTLPVGKHCENESYARMLVRFAELNVIQDVNKAEDNFKIASSHCQNFAFVHIAHAQFEHSQGNTKRAIYLLQNALELGAKPKEVLETALQNMQGGKTHLFCPEDKENIQLMSTIRSRKALCSKKLAGLLTVLVTCTSPVFLIWGRIRVVPFSIPENEDDGHDDGYISEKPSRRSDASVHNSLSSPEHCPWEDQTPADSTTTLLHTRDASKLEGRERWTSSDNTASHLSLIDVTYNFDLVIKTNSPESCLAYLMNLEQRGNPHTDSNLLNKLKDCYSRVFSKLPIRQYSKNTRYCAFQEKRVTPTDPRPVSCVPELLPTPSVQLSSRQTLQTACQTPNGSSNHNANSFVTPVVKRGLDVSSSAVAQHRTGTVRQPFTTLSQTPSFQTPQSSFTSVSNESITIKGKQFYILKMIGRGGSSKVFISGGTRFLDHKKQLFAVKYVDLEEADAQTIESYKNEIEHLNHSQQYSDQLCKLSINMVRPSLHANIVPLMLKSTMLCAGIVHSELKPANFVIVNASLKLIDFGIANRIQPDVTSIMKDSQVGTLNYMPPEAIKDTSSQPGKARSKISPKGDVWSLGCILYCMTYGKTPFQTITNQIAKLQAIIDPSHKIEFPDISEKDLLDVLKRCLVRNPRERISIAELLDHPYLQLKPQASPEQVPPINGDLKKILTDLAALQSPNSIVRAANTLVKYHC
uniref:Ttk protein kinase n=1 Tax=Tetraodon nigroviridis TaxID=99883 RepID=H3CN46_TETNG